MGREPWRAVHGTEGRCQSEASILQLIAGEWDSGETGWKVRPSD